MEGNGTLYFDGGRYEGQFKENKKNGKGKYYKGNNLLYDGDFKNDNFNGNGIYYFENDYIYIGEFKNDKKEGHGIVYDNKNKEVYKGQFINDEPVDKNKCIIF